MLADELLRDVESVVVLVAELKYCALVVTLSKCEADLLDVVVIDAHGGSDGLGVDADALLIILNILFCEKLLHLLLGESIILFIHFALIKK